MARTVSAYGPKMLEAWRKAATEGLSVALDRKQDAVALRHRFYSLRKALQAEGHELFDLAKNVILQIKPRDDGKWLLVAATADVAFDKELDEAGVQLVKAPDLSGLDDL